MATKSTRKNADKTLAQTAVFSLTGSFNPTDFRFHQTTAEHAAELVAQGKSVNAFRVLPSVELRTHQGFIGTNSSHLGAKDAANQKEIDARMSPNLGARDIATLDADKDTLVVVGTVKFVAHYAKPTMSDNPAYTSYHKEFVESYLQDGQLPELRRRYLSNLVNGRVLWRNQYGFSRRAVISLRSSDTENERYVITNASGAEFERLVARTADLAAKPKGYFNLEIALIVEHGVDAEVFPSQLFIEADDKAKLRKVSKDKNYGRVLASRTDVHDKDQVLLGANKIGNALRTVDLGYAEDAEDPIAVELYGAVMTERVAHRYSNKTSYFDLITSKRYADMTPEERHYVMAVFLKGGVLGFAKEE